MEWKCRKLAISDCNQIVRIHKLAFANFFLTQLGTFFLNTYYRSSIKNENCIAVGVFSENNLLGFAIGTIMSKGYHSILLKQNFFAFLLCAITILLTRPNALLRLKNNMDKVVNPDDNGNYAELLSIGLDPVCSGIGIGSELMKEFERKVHLMNGKTITLTTDKNNNEDVIAFYTKRGYVLFYEFLAYPNRKMLKLIKNIR